VSKDGSCGCAPPVHSTLITCTWLHSTTCPCNLDSSCHGCHYRVFSPPLSNLSAGLFGFSWFRAEPGLWWYLVSKFWWGTSDIALCTFVDAHEHK
jgi:hypothetical protein